MGGVIYLLKYKVPSRSNLEDSEVNSKSPYIHNQLKIQSRLNTKLTST